MINKTKDKKGISLIVLVITIIVMIILASAIIISLSNNGIIGNAKNAVDLSNEQQVQEMLEITVALLKQENKLDETNLKEELTKNFNEEVEVTKETDGSYTVGVKETYFTIEDGKIIKGKYDKWDGTSSEPTNMTNNEIHIYKASELKWLQEQVAEGTTFEGYTIYLENNLDLGARENTGDTEQEKWKTEANKAVKWTPIGKTTELALKAKFEGNDHIIKGVYVEDTTNYSGLFGVAFNNIQNLSIKNSYIEGLGYTGGIVGATTGDVINCNNINTTVVTIEGGSINTGGIAGIASNITNCTNSGNIISYGKYNDTSSQVGGIVGRSKKNIVNCENYGNVYANGYYGGGIVAWGDGNIENCINRGEITSSRCTGGIVACQLNNTTISNCINLGNVNAEADYSNLATGNFVGGIVGATDKEVNAIVNCYNAGVITGDESVGGIIGGAGTNPDEQTYLTTIEKCYNIGEVKGRYYIGGIVGRIIEGGHTSMVQLCYNKGMVTGKSNLGSVVGYQDSATGNTYKHLYYLSSLNLGAINGVDNIENNVTSTTKDINTFEEFKTWITQFENS